ncbi:MAG: hypothetical protein E7548_06145 [Ruminococcaceae bacterium]|nr:hypothetical protein [Oscillospiraceae bacterium]
MKNTTQKGFTEKFMSSMSALSDKTNKYYSSKKTPGKKTLIIGFVLIILALALFSVITLIDENKNNSSSDMSEIDPAILNQSGQHLSANLIFAFTDTEKTEVLSLMSVDFNSKDKKLVYSFIYPGSLVTVNGTTSSLSGHFTAGGTNQLISAVSALTGTQYDRYIVANDNSLGQLFHLLGDTTMEIENRISYEHNGVSFIIDEGTRTLTPDMMLKYYLYLISNKDANSDKIASIIINCFERLVDCEDDTSLENNFCTAIGYFDTNISALDYSNNKEILRSLPEMNLSAHATAG